MIKLLSRSEVQLLESWGTDLSIVQAARTSTLGADTLESGESRGLINYLWRSRHTVPFERVGMTVQIHTPIFTVNQIVRHRTFSYSVESARYRELEPVFYSPSEDRPLEQVGKTGDYNFVEDSGAGLHGKVVAAISNTCEDAWWRYTMMLENGVAKEVARMVLPLNIFSTVQMTGNLHAWFNFIRLRNDHHAQYEVREVARQVEALVEKNWPDAYSAYKEARQE